MEIAGLRRGVYSCRELGIEVDVFESNGLQHRWKVKNGLPDQRLAAHTNRMPLLIPLLLQVER